MGLGKRKERFNLDLNLPPDDQGGSFREVGFQDSADDKEMGFEPFDQLDDDLGKGSSLTCTGVELSETTTYGVEERAKGITNDDPAVSSNGDLGLGLDLDDVNLDVEIDPDFALDMFGELPVEEQVKPRDAMQSLLMLNSRPAENNFQLNELAVSREANNVHINENDAANKQVIRRKGFIRRREAKRHARPQQPRQEEETEKKFSEVDNELDDPESPFSVAMEQVKKRILSQNVNNKSLHDLYESLINWAPAENRERHRSVPKLVDLCLSVLAMNADKIVSLQTVPDHLRHKLSKMVSSRGKMDVHFVELLARDSPSEIRLWVTSKLTENDCTQIFSACDTERLEVLQLDLCGQCMPDYVLQRILARPLWSFNKLVAISLKGAHRLSDAGLNSLAKSAPALLSINLNQCSLLTSAGINDLASHFESTLRELYIDDCQHVNVMHVLPSFKKFKHLEVLSVAGVQTVKDDFVIELVEACGKNMKELVLADCVNLTDMSVKFVSKNCPKLCALDLSHLRSLTDSALQYLSNGCQSISKLKLCRNDFSDEAIAAFLEASGMSLTELSLNNICKVDVNTALSIARCLRNLLILDLSWCRKLTNEALGLIVDSCLSLKVIKLFGCMQVTDVFLKGHSNSQLHIIGSKNSLFLEHLDPLGLQQAPLKYPAASPTVDL